MSSGNTPLVVIRPHAESSQPTPRRYWRSLGPPSRALGARLNANTNHCASTMNHYNFSFIIHVVALILLTLHHREGETPDMGLRTAY